MDCDLCGLPRQVTSLIDLMSAMGVLRDAPVLEEAVEFSAPTEGADIVDDYASMGLTLCHHPWRCWVHLHVGLVARVLRGHDWFERVKSTLYRGPLIYKGFPDVKPAAT
jgi:hypothetical protein